MSIPTRCNAFWTISWLGLIPLALALASQARGQQPSTSPYQPPYQTAVQPGQTQYGTPDSQPGMQPGVQPNPNPLVPLATPTPGQPVTQSANPSIPQVARQQQNTLSQPPSGGAPTDPTAGQPVAQPVAQPIGPPFQLSEVEAQFVDQVLVMWENESSKINTYNCEFDRWEYDPVFGPGDEIPIIKSHGQLTYAKPDKGSFKIEDIQRWVQQDPEQPGEHVLQKDEVGEHWVCDGKAIYEYKHDKRQLVVQALPEELRGKSIVDGPLPFLFGAEADKLKQRYWIRSPKSNETTIFLEAYPRRQVDAANYHHVDVMLDRKTMVPKAIQVHMPNNRNRAVYMFGEPTINSKMDKLFGGFFQSPRTPLGWTKVVQPQPETAPQATLPQRETSRQ